MDTPPYFFGFLDGKKIFCDQKIFFAQKTLKTIFRGFWDEKNFLSKKIFLVVQKSKKIGGSIQKNRRGKIGGGLFLLDDPDWGEKGLKVETASDVTESWYSFGKLVQSVYGEPHYSTF